MLVTGGTGFLGALGGRRAGAQRGHRVRVLARGELGGAGRARRRGRRRRRGARSRRRRRRWRARFDGCSAVFHLAGFVSRDPDDGQRMMRVHIDGTRRVLEAAKAAGVRRVVLASTSGTIAVSKEPVDPRRARALPHRDRRRLALLPLEDLPGEAGARPRRRRSGSRSSSSTRACCSGPGDERSSSTGDVRRFLKREIPVVPDGRRQLRRRARRGRGDGGRARARAAPASATSSAGPTGPSPSTSAGSSARRRCARRGSSCRTPLQRRAASLLEHAYKALDKRAARRAHLGRDGAGLLVVRLGARRERELGFVARDPGETLDDTIRDLRTRMI